MQPDEIKSYGCVAKWLTEGEAENYNTFEHHLNSNGIMKPYLRALESLAATRELSERRRVLMEKLHWRADDSERGAIHFRCISCGNPKKWDDKPDCAWDAALKDVGGE